MVPGNPKRGVKILEDIYFLANYHGLLPVTGQEVNIFSQEVGSMMKLSIMPRSGKLKEEDKKKFFLNIFS